MKDIWLKPPKYKGWNPNKKSLVLLAQMAVGLTALSKDASVTARLKSIASKLEMMATVVGRRIDAYPNIYSIWIDLNALRTSLSIDDRDEENILNELDQDIISLRNLVDNNVFVNAGEMKMSRSLRTFMGKETFVKMVYFSTMKSLGVEQKKLARLQEKPESTTNTLQIRLCQTAIRSLTQSAQIFVSITENLALLETFCKQSTTLCNRVNRLIDTKKLSNFIDQPEHSQNEARSMHTQLLLILENIQGTLATENVWNDLQDKGNQNKPLEMVTSSTVSDNKPNESEQQIVSEAVQQTGGESTAFQKVNKNGGVL